MSNDKETTNLSDLDEQLLNEAIVSTNLTSAPIFHIVLVQNFASIILHHSDGPNTNDAITNREAKWIAPVIDIFNLYART